MDRSAMDHSECFITAADLMPAIPEANAEELAALQRLEAELPGMNFEQRLAFFDEASAPSKLGERALSASLELADTTKQITRVLRRGAYYQEVIDAAEEKFTQALEANPPTFEEGLALWDMVPDGSRLSTLVLEKTLAAATTTKEALMVGLRAAYARDAELQERVLQKATGIFERTKETLPSREVYEIFQAAPPGSKLKVAAINEFASDSRAQIVKATRAAEEA